MKKFFIVCMCICLTASMTACSKGKASNSTTTAQQASDTESDASTDSSEDSTLALDDTKREVATKDNLTVKYGKIYDVYDGNEKDDSNNILIIQVQLDDASSEDIVLEQNFLNLEDLVKNQDCSSYDEIQYVGKVRNTENKLENIITFTADKNCMNQISTAAITVEEYKDNVKDLWTAELPIEVLQEDDSSDGSTGSTSSTTSNGTSTSAASSKTSTSSNATSSQSTSSTRIATTQSTTATQTTEATMATTEATTEATTQSTTATEATTQPYIASTSTVIPSTTSSAASSPTFNTADQSIQQ